MNFLEELYYGNLCPCSYCFYNTAEYTELLESAVNYEKILNDTLSESEVSILDQMTKAIDDMHSIESLDYFIGGWRLCAKFILDTFSEL